ncbi:MAG: glycoside hydrolase family 28 protein [Bacteroidales bacterium]|nr:glycoside hydrolase family 28 protein [Bacteroidales bacterium]
MKPKYFIHTLAGVLLNLFLLNAQQKDIHYYLSKAPFKMPEVTVPVFPDKQFSIIDYGAIGDGQALNTKAFTGAIQACAEAGGGKVIVPAGIWLTGPIELKSNINLHVVRGAVIQFTSDRTQYPMVKATAVSSRLTTASPIFGYNLKNIAITGEGIIDGYGESWRPVKKEKTTEKQWSNLVKSGGVVSEDGKIWWPSKEALEGQDYLKTLSKNNPKPAAEDYLPARDFLRPYMVYLSYCENILVEGVMLRNSPKFVFYPNNCKNLTMRYVSVFNEWYAQNGDGIDISACKNVIVYKCNVDVGDDAICMKSSRGDDAPGEASLQNVIIAACNVYRGHGGFVIGSNTDGGMQNVFVTDMNMVGTDIGIRIKSGVKNGGVVKNIYIENIYMSRIINEAISVNTFYENRPAGYKPPSTPEELSKEKTPEFSRFFLKNIYCHSAKTAMELTGMEEMPLKDFYFENIVISADKGIVATDVENSSFDNVKILPSSGPVFMLNNARQINITSCPLADEEGVFLSVSGEKTSGIVISETPLPKTGTVIQFAEDMDKKSVVVK